MTKGEARKKYLRYIGGATVNGSSRDDADLADIFENLLYPAMVQVAASFPAYVSVGAPEGEWEAPEGFTGIVRAFDDAMRAVTYIRTDSGRYRFDAPCTVVYTRLPRQPDPAGGDGAALDVEERAVQLVPIQTAIYAAQAMEEYAFMTPLLATSYNAIASSISPGDALTYRRVYKI